jgi:hypothetical protein
MVILTGRMLLMNVVAIILTLIMMLLLVNKDVTVTKLVMICTLLLLYLPTFKVSLTLLVLPMIVVGMTDINVLDLVL